MSYSRRGFLLSSATAAAAGAVTQMSGNNVSVDGPATPGFFPLRIKGNRDFDKLAREGRLSEQARQAVTEADQGAFVGWGIPFHIERPILLHGNKEREKLDPFKAGWLVFLHTSDSAELEPNEHGFISPMHGEGRLGEHVADYIVVYSDGTRVTEKILRRHHIGMFRARWGENCMQAVAHHKPYPLRPTHEQPSILLDANAEWGTAETRARTGDRHGWTNWLWAWENPHPEKEIEQLRFEGKTGVLVISAITAGEASSCPLRWGTRQKALLRLGEGEEFDYDINGDGLWKAIQLDMGQVISAQPRLLYPTRGWDRGHDNEVPEVSKNEVLIEYAAHPDAKFHLTGGRIIPVADVAAGAEPLMPVKTAKQRVRIRVTDRATRRLVGVKLHIHGESGEYLAPVDRHRQPNPAWFQDYSPEFQHQRHHRCVYISGDTTVELPHGTVYIEVSKGFEIKPVRMTAQVDETTETLDIAVEKLLLWRERGWVTADTHVHFLSPATAQLEGEAEGVNVVNLLASQWSELMTNVGDFDGRTTFGSKDAGGDGEWLVRVGTENRQHVMGHISLLGYNGGIIAPMCAGGPDEAALGDPVDVLLMEWAEQCRAKGGIVVLPHFPNPRAENAAALIEGLIDGIEFTSWGNHYAGIDPYTLSDWYRYLNCGYFIAAVGGTDKMSATTAVGTVRTYTYIPRETGFNYDTWKAAVRDGHTFVTYGPLMEFSVEGKPSGSRIELPAGGGTVDVSWEVASVTMPMTRADLMVNGEVRESVELDPEQAKGSWSVALDRSSWVALLVRGQYVGKPEMVAAHSSPVMLPVAGSEFFAPADALTILDQIEGAMAYLDTVGTRAEDAVYKRMRMKLTGAYRRLHNRLHEAGYHHEHTAATEHS